MRRPIRRLACALLTSAFVLCHAVAAPASAFKGRMSQEPNSVPVVFDALFLRPAGLVMTAVGTVFFFFPVGPMVMLSRPTDIGKPFSTLVINPARFTFVDPLGYHPNRHDAPYGKIE